MGPVTSLPPDPDAPRPADAPEPPLTPLLPDDPPRIGPFWTDARLAATASGVAYVAHDENDAPVLLVQLSEGAASDAAARDRLAGAVNTMHLDTVVARGGEGQDAGRLGRRFRAGDEDPATASGLPQAPWVALAYDGSPAAAREADRVLAVVSLSGLPNQGRPSGPDYAHYWIEQPEPGRWRLWPLPWPGRHDRAGWLSILASWVLMMLLMCLAVLIAILLFQAAPPTPPPPPVPTSASGSGSGSPSSPPPSSASSSASPSSASPSSASPSSASPSSASPSSGSPSPSTASASPSESADGPPTANPRL